MNLIRLIAPAIALTGTALFTTTHCLADNWTGRQTVDDHARETDRFQSVRQCDRR